MVRFDLANANSLCECSAISESIGPKTVLDTVKIA
jgi:hypothetical protein